ncbi:FCRLA protein, partial [Pardalotus punctatus]|nr:FCRLA protein [Pardalotus punctatus]
GPPCPPDWLVLQVPARALLEGDTVTLRCRVRSDTSVTSVAFYREGTELAGSFGWPELALTPVRPEHGGRYRCGGSVVSEPSRGWGWSKAVTVTVHGEPPKTPQ